MRIVFLGTGHAVPESDRKCTSTLIEVGQRRYLVDIGCEIVEPLRKRGTEIESIQAIFLTHMHGDHANGLIPLLDMCAWRFRQADPAIFVTEPVEAVKAGIDGWLQCTGGKLRNDRFYPVKEGLLYEDEAIRVTAFRTAHTKSSYAYLIEAEGKRVLFTGDLSGQGPQVDFPVSVLDAPLDLAICESAHFEATAYLPLFSGCENLKRVCFHHYFDLNVTGIYTVMNTLSHIPVSYARDGTELTV